MEGRIFGIIIVFFALLSIGYAVYSYLLAARARSWPRAEGTVAQVSIKHTRGQVQGGRRQEW